MITDTQMNSVKIIAMHLPIIQMRTSARSTALQVLIIIAVSYLIVFPPNMPSAMIIKIALSNNHECGAVFLTISNHDRLITICFSSLYNIL